MIDERMKITMTTGHLAFKDVASQLNTNDIYTKIKKLSHSLLTDFGIRKPKIAVLALNPHAGDHGMFGNEEEKIIAPACEKARNEGLLAFGPLSPDGFFASMAFKKYDAILAMYHDQALIPFKLLSGQEGVNYTAGLPIVRTSPDHGTAFDIAGKNIADETSLRNAVYAAIDIVRSRKSQKEITANPLKKVNPDLIRGKDEISE
jgi:4-hydroxythreonine-4-phosphate dehydrogenase